MTTHEYDAYLDAQDTVIDDRYHEDILLTEAQMQDEREMKEAYDAALQRQGAKDALHELKRYLLYIAVDDRFADERKGISESVRAINRRLSDLEVTPEVGGEFPEGYFAEGSAA